MTSTYKVLKSTHTRPSPTSKEKGGKLSKGDLVEVIDTEKNGDSLWVQLDAARWACAERGSEVLLRQVSKLVVTVVEAKELLAMDSDGTSDPFFRLYIEDSKKKAGKKQETPVVNDTLTPKYTNTAKCTFEFVWGESDVFLGVECYDKDMMGKDKIGTVHVPLDQIENGTHWYPLKTSRDEPAGEVLLHFGPNPPAPSSDDVPPAEEVGEASTGEPAEDAESMPPPPQDAAPPAPEAADAADGAEEATASPRDTASDTANDGEDATDGDVTDRGVSLDGGEPEAPAEDAVVAGAGAAPVSAAPAAAPAAAAVPAGPPSLDVTVHTARKLLVKDSGGTRSDERAVCISWGGLSRRCGALLSHAVTYVLLSFFFSFSFPSPSLFFLFFLCLLRAGKNDPYCELKLEDAKGRALQREETEVQKNTEVPVWDVVFQFEDTEKAKALRVDVYDKDMIGSNFIGRVSIPVDEARALGGQKWFTLKDKKGRADAGEVSLTIMRGNMAARARKGGMLGTFKGAVSGTMNVATSGVKGVGNVASSGMRGVSNAARAGVDAGVSGVTTVASTGARGVTTVASAGARGVGGAASMGMRGVGGAASLGVRGVTGVASAGAGAVRGVGSIVEGGVRGVAGVAGFGEEEMEDGCLDVDAQERFLRKHRAIQKELEKDGLTEFKEFITSLTPEEKNWLKAIGAIIFIYFVLNFSVSWITSFVASLVLSVLGYD
eukprot:TRINITY_DN237_c0_g1_i2.p1 TRINITY_DN237_c0_g1~~TRINITY_DN237_c0_g1_i2.p1  ORF type:complete len:718 (-),score=200.10 TRINITY_DN237_c0_g1_i2:180-2333(-)